MNEKQWNQLQIGAALGYPRRGPISVEEQRMVVAEIKRLKAIEAAARDFVTVLQEDHDLTKPVVLPAEIDTLIDALKGTGEKGA